MMKTASRKVILVILMLIVSGCTKNQPDNSKPLPSDPKPPSVEIDVTKYGSSSTLIGVESNSGLPELTYELKFETVAPIQRIFVLVDGQPSEFSLNGSEMSMYHDMQGEDFSSEKIRVNPSINGKKKGDKAVVTPYLVLMDESISYTNNLYVFYLGKSLGVSAEIELESFVESKVTPRKSEFTQKLLSKFESEKQEIQSLIMSAETVAQLGIHTNDTYHNKKGFNGFVYDEKLEYYLSKVGIGDVLVYPLLNGKYMTDEDGILSYHFPKSKEIDEMAFSAFDLQKYNIQKGDIITLLTWDINEKTDGHSYAKIAIDPEWVEIVYLF